jgi:UPF0716 protein FxsA
MRFSLIPLLLLVIPVLEIVVFIAVGGQIGIAATLGMILLTAIGGSILLRIQGFATLSRIRAHMDAGTLPGRELGNGAMILVAGVLLLTPGFVTDSLGFLLFVPAVRSFIWSSVASHIVVQTTGFGNRGPHSHPSGDPGVVDLDPEDLAERPDPSSPWRGGSERRNLR